MDYWWGKIKVFSIGAIGYMAKYLALILLSCLYNNLNL